MPIEILMPALSPTMEEGKLAKWLVKEGQPIKAGDIIAEIETDKATMEVEASDEGKVGRILVAEGTEGVKVNTPIATLLAEGESAGAPTAAKAPPAAKPAAPQPAPQTSEGALAAPPRRAPGPAAPPPAAQAAARSAASSAPVANGHGRIFASPLARRLARELGVDVAMLNGSGPRGRIIRRDVESAMKDGGAQLRA